MTFDSPAVLYSVNGLDEVKINNSNDTPACDDNLHKAVL